MEMRQVPLYTLTKMLLLRKALPRRGFHLSCRPQRHGINNASIPPGWMGDVSPLRKPLQEATVASLGVVHF